MLLMSHLHQRLRQHIGGVLSSFHKTQLNDVALQVLLDFVPEGTEVLGLRRWVLSLQAVNTVLAVARFVWEPDVTELPGSGVCEREWRHPLAS